MAHTIRDVNDNDLDAVLILNESVVPAVNSLSRAEMQWFAANAAYFRAVDTDRGIGAFLIGLLPGLDYASPNYRWFLDRYETFGYIDRVAVADHARRTGLASLLYSDFRATLGTTAAYMTCEVNVRPPNEGSMRFHRRQGFERVGTQETDEGQKEVALFARQLNKK